MDEPVGFVQGTTRRKNVDPPGAIVKVAGLVLVRLVQAVLVLNTVAD
jgi:hypothetical protein